MPPHTLCDVSPLQARPDLGALTTQQSQLFLNKFLKLQEDRCTKNGIKYVKRVIGIPGDSVQIINGKVSLNGKLLNYETLGKNINNRFVNPNKRTLGCYNQESILLKETLPSGKSYEILDTYQNLPQDNTQIYRVPPDHYFVLGDNRDNSQDSRFIKKVGFIPHDNLVGRAEIKFFSWHWRKLGKKDCNANVRWDRIFRRIY